MSADRLEERRRVVIAGPGPGGPEPSAEVVARVLRDAGMEVVYTGLDQTPEQLAATVVQEDADALGVAVATEAHRAWLTRLAEVLAERGIDDVAVFAGGAVADAEVPELERLGVRRVFGAGTDPTEIADWVVAAVSRSPGS